MRLIVSLLVGSLTVVYGMMIPFSLFVVRSHDWTLGGSSFLGSMVFALFLLPTPLIGATLLVTLPKLVLRKRSHLINYRWVAWVFIGVLFGSATGAPIASMALGACAGLLAAFFDLRIDPPVECEGQEQLQNKS